LIGKPIDLIGIANQDGESGRCCYSRNVVDLARPSSADRLAFQSPTLKSASRRSRRTGAMFSSLKKFLKKNSDFPSYIKFYGAYIKY